MMRPVTLFLLFFALKASGANPDSTAVYKMPDDTAKVMALIRLAEDEINIEKKNHFASKALAISEKIRFTRGIYQSYLFLGNYAYHKGQYDKAVRYYTRTLTYYDKVNYMRGKADVSNNIGSVFLAQNNFTEALKYFEMAYQWFHTMNHKDGEGRALNNIGNVYFNRSDYDIALSYYNRSLEIKIKTGDKSGEGLLLNNIGNIYGVKGDYRKSLEYFTKALQLKEASGDKLGLALAHNNIGSLYTLLRDSSRAMQHIRQGLQIARETGSPDLCRDAYSSMAEVSYEFGNYKEAYAYFQLASEIKDSLINTEMQKNIREIEARYTNEKKDAEHKAELERFKLQEEKDRIDQNRKNTLIYGLIAVVSLALILLIVVLRSNRIKQKNNLLLSQQKQLIETKNEQLSEKNKNITDSLNYAKRLQDVILPSGRQWNQLLPQSFILYKPKDIVAGDFYWIGQVGQQVVFAVADCTGHGVPGAMVSVICHNALNRALREFNLTDPGKILDQARNIILDEFGQSDEEVKDGMDISLCSINTHTFELQWAGANNPLWLYRKGTLNEYKPDKQPVGKYAAPRPFTTHHISLEKGDILYLFTDGYQDQFGGPAGKKFKASRLKELLTAIHSGNMPEQSARVEMAFENWKNGFEQVDDVCLIGIKI